MKKIFLDEIPHSQKVFWRIMGMNMIQNHIPSLIDQILVIQHLLFIPALQPPPRELGEDQFSFIHLSLFLVRDLFILCKSVFYWINTIYLEFYLLFIFLKKIKICFVLFVEWFRLWEKSVEKDREIIFVFALWIEHKLTRICSLWLINSSQSDFLGTTWSSGLSS